MIRKTFFLLCFMALIASCAPVISQTTMNTVDKSITFPALQKNPDDMKGKIVLLGGQIIATIPKAGETWIEVLEKPLDYQQRPSDADQSAGRFLVRVQGFLDPTIYEKGRKLTVAGQVEGKIIRPLSEINYTYPVISAREQYLWQPADTNNNPRFSIGIGGFGGGRGGGVGGGVGVGF